MEKVRPWCGQPSGGGRLKNRTYVGAKQSATATPPPLLLLLVVVLLLGGCTSAVDAE